MKKQEFQYDRLVAMRGKCGMGEPQVGDVKKEK